VYETLFRFVQIDIFIVQCPGGQLFLADTVYISLTYDKECSKRIWTLWRYNWLTDWHSESLSACDTLY